MTLKHVSHGLNHPYPDATALMTQSRIARDGSYMLVYDPGPDPYTPGAIFNELDLRYSCKDAFNDGTIFRRDGRDFVWQGEIPDEMKRSKHYTVTGLPRGRKLELIMEALRKAGGLSTVANISDETGFSGQAVYDTLSTRAENFGDVVRVSRGVYKLKEVVDA